jgi:hypothetical protein
VGVTFLIHSGLWDDQSGSSTGGHLGRKTTGLCVCPVGGMGQVLQEGAGPHSHTHSSERGQFHWVNQV